MLSTDSFWWNQRSIDWAVTTEEPRDFLTSGDSNFSFIQQCQDCLNNGFSLIVQ